MEYVKRPCEECGIILPQNEMHKKTIQKLITQSSGGSVDFLTIPGNQSPVAGGYSPSKAQKTRADIRPSSTYQTVDVWYCNDCYKNVKGSFIGSFFRGAFSVLGVVAQVLVIGLFRK